MRFCKSRAVWFQLFVLLSLISPVALAKESRPIIKIGIPEHYPPFYYLDSDGEMRGASFDIVAHILKTQGYGIEVTQFANMRSLFNEMTLGRQDVIVNLTATEDRKKIALFTQTAHIYETQDFIVRADSQIQFSGKLLSVANFRFGNIYGWTYGPQFDGANYLNKVYVNDSVEQLKKLLSGQYDIAVNNKLFFYRISEQLNVENAFKVLSPSIYQLPVTIAVSRKYPNAQKLVSQLEAGVQSFKQTKQYQAILKQYGFESEEVTTQGESQ